MSEKTIEFLKRVLQARGLEGYPASLFKFVNSESRYFQLAMHELFLHNRLYLSGREDFNDPFDTAVSLAFDTPAQIETFVEGVRQRGGGLGLGECFVEHLDNPAKFAELSNERVAATLDAYGIYSLSDSVVHPLMWAHYSCSHRGIALIFDHTELPDAMPMEYLGSRSPDRPSADGMDHFQLLSKGLPWSYEREWRLIEPRRARTWFSIPTEAFKGFVVGARCCDQTIAFLVDLVERRADAGMPPLIMAKAMAERFALTFSQLTGEDEWVPISLP